MNDYEIAKQRYLAGITIEKSVEGLNIGKESFRRRLDVDGVQMRINRVVRLTEEQMSLVLELRSEGKSIRQIEKDTGIERHKISVELKKIDESTKDLAKHKYNEDAFDKIDTREKAYWFGFMMADGYTRPLKNIVGLTLKNSDEAMLRRFANFLGEGILVGQHSPTAKRVLISNKKIHDDLVEKGCIHRKSWSLQFPSEEHLPRHLQRDFIRGYYDGDGGLFIDTNSRNKKTISLLFHVTATHKFIDQLKIILDCNNKPNKSSESPFIVTLRIKGNQKPLRLLDWLYEDTDLFLPRKKAIYEEFKRLKSLNCRPSVKVDG